MKYMNTEDIVDERSAFKFYMLSMYDWKDMKMKTDFADYIVQITFHTSSNGSLLFYARNMVDVMMNLCKSHDSISMVNECRSLLEWVKDYYEGEFIDTDRCKVWSNAIQYFDKSVKSFIQ